ncbi:SCO family protein [Bordetella genomosp. 4]|uniref:Thioredoxin domain-containing protein n=1 Tax=Bordetella genomosp. 4 TaxID=463044 RepID=A0A261V3I7_9BORD|nr:hypothetical protein [Bordetella genomosp. 4]OZI54017.1 hypothetical protein CAL21_00080 [Bordetella genomosp. 4]OZI67733.1 hypothetical protein CAL20_01445 [Bordetella genomosp. 4]
MRVAQVTPTAPAKKRSLIPLVLVFLCTLAPILAAFVMYNNPQWWPEGSSNYGTLIEPQRPMPSASELQLTTLEGKPFDLQSLKGKWLLLSVDEAACPESCARKLFITRNSHASQGKNVDRLARVWFITDDGDVPAKVLEAYQGTIMVRARPEQLARFLVARGAGASTTPTSGQPSDSPVPSLSNSSLSGQSTSSAPSDLLGPIWVIDPLGNLMLQFPPEADGVKVRKDISKLIYSSRIG